MYKIIDISNYQKGANLAEAINNGIDGFIFRLGLGDNIQSQDDTTFEDFVAQAEALNKPWGTYIFSYAISEQNVESEIAHALRCVAGKNPQLGVWWDLENSDYKERNGFEDLANGELVVSWAKRFISAMNDNGYTAGLYCDLNHARNLNLSGIEHLWIAAYFNNPDFNNPPYNCDIWQYTSTEAIAGVADHVDTNIVYAQWIKNIIYGIENNNNNNNESEEGLMTRQEANICVTTCFIEHLGRLADPSGLEAYSNAIIDRPFNCDLSDLDRALMDSDEYKTKHKRDFIINCYHVLLGRDPENEEVIQARMGYTYLRDIVADIMNSDEYKNRQNIQ